ncbi:MAG: MBL fold metallo-hydrolase [Thermodesulfobacteriota bacterium]
MGAYSDRIVEVLPDLFFIRRGYLNANHFAYRSVEPVLVDTGYLGGFEETEQALSGLGVNLSRVRLIVNTHCHCDHVGGNRIIQDRSGCETAMHKIGRHFIEARDDWSTWWRYYAQEAEFFRCDRSLEEGDIVSLGPHEFEVLYTPGHSADGMVLFNKREKLLISSDTLWEHDMAVMTVRVEGSRALFSMQESLEKLRTLHVKTVCPGHGPIFTDFRGALARAEQRVGRFLRDPAAVGNDLVKKIMVYTLMMKRGFREEDFLPYLMTTPWFPETVDLYFDREYERVFCDTVEDFCARGVIVRSDGLLRTTVEP